MLALLAQASGSGIPDGTFDTSVKMLGPAGGLLVILTVMALVLYKFIFAPELAAYRTARAVERAESVKIAEAQATSAKALDSTTTDLRLATGDLRSLSGGFTLTAETMKISTGMLQNMLDKQSAGTGTKAA